MNQLCVYIYPLLFQRYIFFSLHGSLATVNRIVNSRMVCLCICGILPFIAMYFYGVNYMIALIVTVLSKVIITFNFTLFSYIMYFIYIIMIYGAPIVC